MDEQQAGRRDPRRQLRHLPVGLVRRARPGRHPGRLHLRPARRALRLLVLQQGATTRCTQQQNQETDLSKREAIVKKMQQQLYEDAPYIVTAYTDDRRGVPHRPVRLLPAAARPRAASGWCSTAPSNYTQLRPAKDAGDCDGIPDAVGAAKSVVVGRRRAAAAATPARIVGGAVLVRAASPVAACSCCGAVERRRSASDRPVTTVVASCADAAGRAPAELRALRRGEGARRARQPAASSWSSTSSCSGCCPATRPGRWAAGRFRTAAAAGRLPPRVRPRPVAAASSS